MVEAYKQYWKRAFDFKGRTSRADFWWAVLAIFLVSFVLGLVLGILGLNAKFTFDMNAGLKFEGGAGLVITSLWSLVNIIPGLSMEVRRLHDTNKTGWLLLLGVIPVINFIGAIVLFIFYLLPGVDAGNKYNN
ncbi:MAG: DUF805 domain-containing protein [Bacilli bacterium]|nr:DUF805 domain-containing protein [Bacilli bacterium]